MKASLYRWAIVIAIVALAGLICVQVYWFRMAYSIQEQQFNERVNISLRAVADQLLNADGNSHVPIKPITQNASNSFFVEIDAPFSYAAVDSLIRKEFHAQNISSPFNLSVYDQADSLILGNFYGEGPISVDNAHCNTREPGKPSVNFAVTFPDKKSAIAGSLDLSIYTAGTFALVLFLFGCMVFDLSRQKKLAQMKNDFVSNMTHELQTPISNISMATEVLRKSDLADHAKANRYLEIIHEENARLKDHVHQVLQVATMERGEFQLRRESVNIHQILSEVIEKFRLRVEGRNGRLSARFNASKSTVVGDPLHLTNIFFNLLDNADKYSKRNPSIEICSRNTDKDLIISIQDQGVGMTEETKKFAFDKFYRGSIGDVHDVKGFGLGLTYVRYVVEAHQGAVSIRHSTGEGSCFDIVIPYVS